MPNGNDQNDHLDPSRTRETIRLNTRAYTALDDLLGGHEVASDRWRALAEHLLATYREIGPKGQKRPWTLADLEAVIVPAQDPVEDEFSFNPDTGTFRIDIPGKVEYINTAILRELTQIPAEPWTKNPPAGYRWVRDIDENWSLVLTEVKAGEATFILPEDDPPNGIPPGFFIYINPDNEYELRQQHQRDVPGEVTTLKVGAKQDADENVVPGIDLEGPPGWMVLQNDKLINFIKADPDHPEAEIIYRDVEEVDAVTEETITRQVSFLQFNGTIKEIYPPKTPAEWIELTDPSDPERTATFIRQSNGDLKPYSAPVDAAVEEDELTGRLFIRQPDGRLIPLPPDKEEADVIFHKESKQWFIKQPDGKLQSISIPVNVEIVRLEDKDGVPRDFLRQKDGTHILLPPIPLKATVITIPGSDGIPRDYIQQPDGTIQLLPDVSVAADIVQRTDKDGIERDFIRYPDGTIRPLPPLPQGAKVVTREGRVFVRQPDGRLELLPDLPGEAVYKAIGGRQGVVQPDGSWEPLPDIPGIADVEIIDGREYIRQPDGTLQLLPDVPGDADVVTLAGRDYIRQPDGTLQLIPPDKPTVDELIAEAFVSGDSQRALDLSILQEDPLGLDRLNAAIQYARSPGDYYTILQMGRGEIPVGPIPRSQIYDLGMFGLEGREMGALAEGAAAPPPTGPVFTPRWTPQAPIAPPVGPSPEEVYQNTYQMAYADFLEQSGDPDNPAMMQRANEMAHREAEAARAGAAAQVPAPTFQQTVPTKTFSGVPSAVGAALQGQAIGPQSSKALGGVPPLSAQQWRNMTSTERAVYVRELQHRGIPPEAHEENLQEMSSAKFGLPGPITFGRRPIR